MRVRFPLSMLTALLVAACTASAQVSAQPARPTPAPPGPVTARELVEASGLSGLMVAPDHKHAVVRVDHQNVEANSTSLTWYVIRLNDGEIIARIDGGDPRWSVNGNLALEVAQWSPDSRRIYLRRLEGEDVQLWRAGIEGNGLQQITDDASDVVAFIIDADGTVHYAVGPATREEIKAAERVEYDHGVVLDRTFIVGQRVTNNFPVNGRMATYRHSPEAANFGRSTLLGELPLRALTLTPDLSVALPAADTVLKRFDSVWKDSLGGFMGFDPEERTRATFPPLSRSASITASTGRKSDKPHTLSRTVLSWTDRDGASSECLATVCSDADQLSIVGWTGDGQDLVFQTWDAGAAALNRWNTGTGTVSEIFRAEGVMGASDSGLRGACQLAGQEAICIAAGPDRPPQLVAVDLASGATRPLFDPNPHLSRDRLGVVRKLILTDRFGGASIAYVVLPREWRAGQRLPLVITSYTCRGFLLGGSGQDVPEHVLAGLGFAAACVDGSGSVVRYAPDFRFTPENSNLSGLDFYEDAVRELAEEGVIDPRRVLLTGFSGSATNTAMAITRSQMFTAAAVTTKGSLDAIACYLASHYRSCADWAREDGPPLPYDSRSGILAKSPAWNADKITAPLLMQLPETEYTGMMQLYGAMTDYGRAVEMVIFPDAYHYKHQPRQRLAVYERNVDWAEFWLRGRLSDDVRDAPQNARWTQMRERQCTLFVGDDALSNPPWYCAR